MKRKNAYYRKRERSKVEPLPVLQRKDKKGATLYPHNKAIPNKALTAREVIDRYRKGLPINAPNTSPPVYTADDMSHDSPDLGELQRMSPQDKKDLARQGVTITMKEKKQPKDAPPKEPKKEGDPV